MKNIAGKANCGCVHHAEEGIPCEHDIALAKERGELPDDCDPNGNPRLPSDYELCGTCGYDHDYDWPYLSTIEREKATRLHQEAGDEVEE